jgi:hypothetical protein
MKAGWQPKMDRKRVPTARGSSFGPSPRPIAVLLFTFPGDKLGAQPGCEAAMTIQNQVAGNTHDGGGLAHRHYLSGTRSML